MNCLGVSDTLLDNTAIAASVEAEEVGRVAAPTRRGKPEVALGNIAGTIVYFIAFNAGVIALVKPLSLDSATLDLHLPVSVASTALLCGLIGIRGRIGRVDGALLLLLYAAYVTTAVLVAFWFCRTRDGHCLRASAASAAAAARAKQKRPAPGIRKRRHRWPRTDISTVVRMTVVPDDRCDLLCLDLERAEGLRRSRIEVHVAKIAAARAGALSDPTRLTLIAALARTDEACVCDLSWVMERAENLVSHHLKVLRQAGLVESRRDGKMVLYALTADGRELVDAVLGQPVTA